MTNNLPEPIIGGLYRNHHPISLSGGMFLKPRSLVVFLGRADLSVIKVWGSERYAILAPGPKHRAHVPINGWHAMFTLVSEPE